MHVQTHMFSYIRHLLLLTIVFGFITPARATSQADSSLRVLIVTAHPDDDVTFAATVYKITHDLHGLVDLALITNGEGGYKYSTLGETIYGLELTDERVGRAHLPTIRK